MPGFHHRTTPDASGTQLTKAEHESVLSHEADSETANDMLYYDGTNWQRATAATIWAILDGTALEASPTNGVSTKAADSNWAYDHNAAKTGVHAAGANNLATDADITTHAALDTGAHGAGGDTLATDADITTHAGIATAHQDAPGLIATHTSNASAHHAGYSAPTRSFWVAPENVSGIGGTEAAKGDYYAQLLVGANEGCGFSFGVPADFSSLTTVKIWGIEKGTNTPTLDWTATTDFGADGEAFNNHSDSATADGEALVADQKEAIDISAAFTGLAAGDSVGVIFQLDAVSGTTPGIWVIGLEFKYAE